MTKASNLIFDFNIPGINFRQLTGYDERYIAETKNLPSFKRSVYLLNRLMIFPMDYSGLTNSERIDKIFRFTIGQRSSLMLYLRQLIFGDNFQCVADCPECKSEMSLDLSINKILQLNENSAELKTQYDLRIDKFSMQIRPLNGYDQETLVTFQLKKKDKKPDVDKKNNDIYNENDSLYNDDRRYESLSKLAKLCIITSEPLISAYDELSVDIISAISEKLEQIEPISNIILNLTCYKCNHSLQTPFYVEDFILHEIDLRKPQLEWEIHWIAFNYHWSEKEILSLSLNQRKNYIELINKTLSE